MIPTKRDFSTDALDKLLWQFQDKNTIETFLEALCDQLGIVQEDLFNIVENFSIEDGYDYLLDMVGKIVGAKRLGRPDEEYRDAIKLKILFNTSNGTPNKILEALATATTATEVDMWEHYPLACTYYTNGDSVPSNLVKAIKSASPATCNVVIYTDPEENSLIPSELDVDLLLLIDHEGNEFVTNNDDNIEAANLNSTLNENPERSILSEYTYGEGSGVDRSTKDGLGILVEVAREGSQYSQEQLQLIGSSNNWWITMNYTVPNMLSGV
ncbi:MAG: hypothetical protein GOVbin4162_38 [Prokaryotic dsDNA virus sp.]|nr:MAG: hypothetical protein GOVbin4162_38 [Prokaryotic dsDNA virus sp.]|tara:strand:- start:187 stop:993 length:807 start_codon:yes stop_codon:yes gene_type:complete